MRLEGLDLNERLDERFEVVSLRTYSVESLEICGEFSEDVLIKDINTVSNKEYGKKQIVNKKR